MSFVLIVFYLLDLVIDELRQLLHTVLLGLPDCARTQILAHILVHKHSHACLFGSLELPQMLNKDIYIAPSNPAYIGVLAILLVGFQAISYRFGKQMREGELRFICFTNT